MSSGKRKPNLSFEGAVQLAAPHTWPAAVLPVLLGTAVSFAGNGCVRPYVLLAVLAAAVLLQSAVNTLNDYRDFVSGLDNVGNCPDAHDAALVYGCSSPKAALVFGLALLLLAAAAGAALVISCGVQMLIYGGLALLAIALYVMPGVSFSDLPLGELLSGTSMGGVLSCAACHAQAGGLSGGMLYICLPAVITVGCIMLVNNTCDIEKDRDAGRRTLPVCIGRRAAGILLRAAAASAAVLSAVIIALRFPGGIPAIAVLAAALATSREAWGIYLRPVSPERRAQSMAAILKIHTFILTAYTAGIVLSGMSK